MRRRGDGENLDDRARLLKLRTLEQCVSDIVVAEDALRSVLPPRSVLANGRSARALARSMNASLRCICGVVQPICSASQACKCERAGFSDASEEDV